MFIRGARFPALHRVRVKHLLHPCAGGAYAASTPTATPAATVAPATKHSTAHCEKLAKEKRLMGDEEKKFVKDCREGKKAD